MKLGRLVRISIALAIVLSSTVLPIKIVLAAVPTVTITSEVVPDVDTVTCQQTGNITATGGLNSTARGFEYDDDGTGAPYTYDAHTNGSYGTGAYTIELTSLSADTTYYIRAYATNPDGTGYSAETTFHTPPVDAYWKDASGNWTDDDNHWADSALGAAGDGNLPGRSTNVHFDANSGFIVGDKTVNMNAIGYFADCDWTGAPNSPIWAGASYGWDCYGSMVLIASMTSTIDEVSNFYSNVAETLTTNGCILNHAGTDGLVFRGDGSMTLQDDLTNNGIIKFVGDNGYVFDTGNHDITIGNGSGYAFKMYDSSLYTQTINLGSSTITLGGGTNSYFWVGDGTELTFNAGTSTIVLQADAYIYVESAGETFYDAEFTGTSSYSLRGDGVNTFHDLTVDVATGSNYDYFFIFANQTITNNLTFDGYSTTYRLLVRSDTPPTYRTLTCNGTVTGENVDFRDIQGAGTASWDLSAITGGSGNAGHNAGITFTTETDCCWVDNSGEWSDITHWSSSSGGVGGTGRIPLVQDTAVFDANSITMESRVIELDMPIIGNIDCEDVLNSPQFDGDGAGGGTVYLYGDIVFGNVNYTPSSSYFLGRGVQNITTNGYTIDSGIAVYQYNYGAVLQLEDDLTLAGSPTYYLFAGTLNLNNNKLTCGTFDSDASTFDRAIAFGSGTIEVIDTGTCWTVINTKMTVGANTGTVRIHGDDATARTFYAGGITTYNNVVVEGSGAYTLTLSIALTCTTLTVDRSEAAKTISGAVTVTLTNLNIPVNGVTVVTITNTDFSKASGTVCSNYLTISGSSAAGGATFYAGTNSTDSGGNAGWNFTNCDTPDVTTLSASNITPTTATLNADLTDLGDFTPVYGYFMYDLTGTWTDFDETAEQELIAIGEYSDDIAGLEEEVTYYFRAVVRYNVDSYIYGTTKTLYSIETIPGYVPGTTPGYGYSSLPGADMENSDIIEETTAVDQTEIPDPTGMTGNPGYGIIHTIATGLNTSGYNILATERMLWYSAGGIFVLIVVIGLLFLIPGHLFISGVGGVAVVGLQVAVGIFPWWTIAVAVIYLTGTIVAEKSNIVG